VTRHPAIRDLSSGGPAEQASRYEAASSRAVRRSGVGAPVNHLPDGNGGREGCRDARCQLNVEWADTGRILFGAGRAGALSPPRAMSRSVLEGSSVARLRRRSVGSLPGGGAGASATR
jgi:hypothetical protein